MKYLLSILLMLSLSAKAVTTPWASYPTTNTFGDTDTFIIGNGATNLTMPGSAIKAAAQTIANTTSNSLQTGINTLGSNLTNDVNTTSNLLVGTSQAIANTTSNSLNGSINTSSNLVYGNALTQINTTSNSLNTSINTSSNLVYGNALTQINTTSNSLQSQITAGGITAVQATNIVNGVTGDVATNGTSLTMKFTSTGTNDIQSIAQPLVNTASNSINTQINTSSNAVYANGIIQATNVVLQVSPVIVAGANMTSTPVQNARGGTNFTVALQDPISVSQINVGTSWLTNTVIPTNAFGGTVIPLTMGYGETNLGGNLTFTGVSGATAGAFNSSIVRLLSGGADRTIAFPASWHTNYGFIGVVTNGWTMDLLVTVTAGRTNVTQILNP